LSLDLPRRSDGAAPATQERYTLAEAVGFALAHSPRLDALRASIERAAGQEQAAFAPFLPQLDLLTRYGVTSDNLSPGAPGPTGGIEPTTIDRSHTFSQAELQVQWLIYDFGRTSGRYGQAVSAERITELQYARGRETVTLDVITAYLQALQAAASRVIQDEAIRQAQATLEDTRARREGGVLTRDAVLRADVQLSEAREGLLLAEEAELAALARLNTVMGRPASLPLAVVDLEDTVALPATLAESLEKAIQQRREIAVARAVVAAAQSGRTASAGEFLPRLYVRTTLGRVDGSNVSTGWQGGMAIHLEQALYHGGKQTGELRAAEAELHQAMARTRSVLDTVTLEVTLAHRAAVIARARIDLDRPAITQAAENLRLVRQRYRNGNATPTDVVDGETALTRARQRLLVARYDSQLALARLEYAVGDRPGTLLSAAPLPARRPPATTLPPPRPLGAEE
jgi:outer membrane protein TolC